MIQRMEYVKWDVGAKFHPYYNRISFLGSTDRASPPPYNRICSSPYISVMTSTSRYPAAYCRHLRIKITIILPAHRSNAIVLYFQSRGWRRFMSLTRALIQICEFIHPVQCPSDNVFDKIKLSERHRKIIDSRAKQHCTLC
jgi:hypothetical protein